MDLGDYVEVKDRLKAALEKFPELRVVEEHAQLLEVADRLFLVCRVAVHRTPDDPLPMVAAAWEPLPGRTPYTRDSELMVGMTSALGRALGYMGFGIGKSIASANEVENRRTESPRIDANAAGGTKGAWNPENGASEKQKRAIYVICKKKGLEIPDVNVMTMAEAGAWIEEADRA
jgi:hypothetical protein